MLKKITALLLALNLFASGLPAPCQARTEQLDRPFERPSAADFIKWVDFTVPAPLMKQALDWDTGNRIRGGAPPSWIEVLAYLGAACGGSFGKLKPQSFKKLTSKLDGGKTMESLTKNLKHYGYYLEAYSAVLGGLAGTDGLTAFHPIAKGFGYQHYDDFGHSRSYGYKRKHLGHDLIAQTGTPVTAVEAGVVEELGWNKYGGWRVGIRSHDGKRYYYYAHLRKNRPYAEGLEKGKTVEAGDVIGYVGRTGYSETENTNGFKESHLHFGIQLIFDESQKEGAGEIWIDPFEIVKLLYSRRSEVVKDPETKEYTRVIPHRESHVGAQIMHPHTAADTGCTVKLPVVMYHSIQKNRSKLGKYTISPDELERDLKWLKENGYQSVTVDQLVRFTEKGGSLPDRPILLTFDDGHYDNVHYADPLLRQYGFNAVVFVVGEFIDKSESEGVQNPNYSYASRDTLKQLVNENTWEVESHSYYLHHIKKGREGCKRARGESDGDYYAVLREDFTKIGALLKDVTGRSPRAFAYPLGAMSAEAEEVLKEMGYKITLSCSLGVAEIKEGEPDSLYKMKRLLRPHGKPLSALLGG